MRDFVPEMQISLDDITPVYKNGAERLLEDGSILIETEDTYTRKYPDGRIAEYHYNDDEDKLFLAKEESPDGRLVIYDYKLEYDKNKDENVYKQVKIYERNSGGHFIYNRYEKEDYDEIGDLIETLEGNINKEYQPETRLNFDDLPTIYEGTDERWLEDGSVLTETGKKQTYVRKYPNGQTAEYHYNDDEDELFLAKEETPDGQLVTYDYKLEYDEEKDEDVYKQVKIYERDSGGHYIYHMYEKEDDDEIGDLIKTIEGHVSERHIPETYIDFEDLSTIYEKGYEQFENGSILTEERDEITYTLKYPNGQIAEYHYNDDEDKLFLAKEETPDGRLVIYDYKLKYDEEKDENMYKQVKIYERDSSGHFIYRRYEKDDDDEIGDLIETIKGNIYDKYQTDMHLDLDNLSVIYEKGEEQWLPDGSVLTEKDSTYTRKYPNGRIAEYHYNDDEDKLFLAKEETPDGRLVIYDYKLKYDEEKDENVYNQVKIYERDSSGHYIAYRYERDDDDDAVSNLLEIIEGNGNQWSKKTFYDEEKNLLFYKKDGDDTKKYYPSGKLMEEKKEDGSIFCYYETGVCQSEEYPNGMVKKYSENGLVLYEKDEEGNYQKFQLNAMKNATLLIGKGDNYSFKEEYQYDDQDHLLQKKIKTSKGVFSQTYYPDSEQKIKEERAPDGTLIKWSKNGRCYQKFDSRDNLIEETNVFGKMTYTYYPGTKKIEHIHKYNESGQDVPNAYKHYDKEGNENTKYYLARKKIIEQRLDKEDQKARDKQIDRIKAIKRRSKFGRKMMKFIEDMAVQKKLKEK